MRREGRGPRPASPAAPVRPPLLCPSRRGPQGVPVPSQALCPSDLASAWTKSAHSATPARCPSLRGLARPQISTVAPCRPPRAGQAGTPVRRRTHGPHAGLAARAPACQPPAGPARLLVKEPGPGAQRLCRQPRSLLPPAQGRKEPPRPGLRQGRGATRGPWPGPRGPLAVPDPGPGHTCGHRAPQGSCAQPGLTALRSQRPPPTLCGSHSCEPLGDRRSEQGPGGTALAQGHRGPPRPGRVHKRILIGHHKNIMPAR